MSTSTSSPDSATVPLWQRTTPMSRDRATRLTPAEIAVAAFAVAENENLPAVSVKRIAGRLGIPSLRLQNYLLDRNDLLDLMVDVALGEVEAVPETADWQAQLWQLAHAVHATAQRRPWLCGLLGLRAPTGPNGLHFTERMLRAVTGMRVDVSAAAQYVESVLTFVYGAVRPTAVSAPPSSPSRVDIGTYLNEQMATGSFPLVSELLVQARSLTASEVFDVGLTHLLTGIAVAAQGLDHDLRVDMSSGVNADKLDVTDM